MSDPENATKQRADATLREMNTRRTLFVVRRIGIGILGLLGGTLLGIILQDVLAIIFVRLRLTGFDVVAVFTIPLFAAAGVVVALLLHQRTLRHRRGGRE